MPLGPSPKPMIGPKRSKKIFPIRGVFKDRLAPYCPDNDVMQGTEGIFAGFTRHAIYVSDCTYCANR